jgi:protein-L-isoaspartate(D-aspartate) O-methyltransferase
METNDKLVDFLVERDSIETEKVEQAFRRVDRGDFTPDRDESHREGEVFLDVQRNPYTDEVYPLKVDSTISQPSVVAEMVELLDLQERDHVLEIGSGSGYQSAIIAGIVEKVVGVEINRDVAEHSRNNLREHDNIEIVHGEGFKKVKSSFDKIIFSCAVDEDKIEEARDYLNENGRIVAPIGQNHVQQITVFDENSDEKNLHSRVRFVHYKES